MKSLIYSAAAVLFAGPTIAAEAVVPTFEFTYSERIHSLACVKTAERDFPVDPDSPTDYESVESVGFPYTRENIDGQCISHPKPVNSIHIFTESGETFTDDYCVYYFVDDALCGGDVSDKVPAPAKSSGKSGLTDSKRLRTSVLIVQAVRTQTTKIEKRRNHLSYERFVAASSFE